MPEWLMSVLVSVVIVGLVSVLYKNTRGAMMTKLEHTKICKANSTAWQKFVEKQTEQLKEYFDLKIENVVMKELRKLNNGGGRNA